MLVWRGDACSGSVQPVPTLRREVKEGTSQTLYPMDPERELENLRRNWATFKRDFKVGHAEHCIMLKLPSLRMGSLLVPALSRPHSACA